MRILFAVLLALPTLSAADTPPRGAAALSGPPELSHSGGCRKSSPPGQCCHAGSQPLHCH